VPALFFKEGERENQENYKNILSTWILPCGDFIYCQDSARPHLGKNVFDGMSSVIRFIPYFLILTILKIFGEY